MTTLTIPYHLEDNNGACAPDYKPEASVDLATLLDIFEAGYMPDHDELSDSICSYVQDDFQERVSPVVGADTLEALIEQVREALAARDRKQA